MNIRAFRNRLGLAATMIATLHAGALARQNANVTSQAAPAGEATQASKTACALHIWPAGEAHSSYTGWFHGGAVDGDERGIKGYPNLHARVLSADVQKQLLMGIDWSTLFPAVGLTVVVHEQPAAAGDDQTRKEPLISDHPPCYQELLVHSVLVERAPFSANTVRVTLISKRWGDSGGGPSTFGSMASERVNLDDQDIKAGFVASVTKIVSSDSFKKYQFGG